MHKIALECSRCWRVWAGNKSSHVQCSDSAPSNPLLFSPPYVAPVLLFLSQEPAWSKPLLELWFSFMIWWYERKDKTNTPPVNLTSIHQPDFKMFEKENLFDKIHVFFEVMFHSLWFGRLTGLPAFKPDPSLISTHCPQTSTHWAIRTQGPLSNCHILAWSRSSPERAGSRLQSREHHSCFKDPTITALAVNTMTPERGTLDSTVLAPSSADMEFFPWWWLLAHNHSNSFKGFWPYKVIYTNSIHSSWDNYNNKT